jgi:hypothetical protein
MAKIPRKQTNRLVWLMLAPFAVLSSWMFLFRRPVELASIAMPVAERAQDSLPAPAVREAQFSRLSGNLTFLAEPPRRAAGAEAAGGSAPSEVTRAFPSITQAVSDWRDFRPDSLTVEPWPGGRITFTRTALKEEDRFVTWIGRNANLPGASLVGVATANGYDAVLVVPGANQVSYHVRGEEVTVTESRPGDAGCAVAPVQLPRALAMSSDYFYAAQYVQGGEPVTEPASPKAVVSPLTVDVLFAYDDASLTRINASRPADATDALEGTLKALVETSNLALSQSLVTAFTWRYVGLVKAPAYPRTGKLTDDLDVFRTGGALYDWAKSMRYKYGADQIALIVGGDADFGGIAFAYSQVAVPADYAVAVIRYGASAMTIAHELAHNFGCRHDRVHVEVTAPGVYGAPASDNDGFWCYGQLWDNPPPPRGFTGTTASSGDIMSYAVWPLPYFSNPNISIHVTGFMFGWPNDLDLGTHQLGLPESDPKAAYTARVLTDQAPAMSGISEAITTLAITRQPQGGAVTRGQSLQLSVSATGGGQAYQWRKGGVPIDGATASFY